jgi:hypothetical protein
VHATASQRAYAKGTDVSGRTESRAGKCRSAGIIPHRPIIYRLTGKVTDESTAQPLAKVTLRFPYNQSATTDSAGTYALEQIFSAWVTVEALAPGFFPERREVHLSCASVVATARVS